MLGTVLGALEPALNSCPHGAFIAVEAKIKQSHTRREIEGERVCVEGTSVLTTVTGVCTEKVMSVLS